jgi:hypothetical protein
MRPAQPFICLILLLNCLILPVLGHSTVNFKQLSEITLLGPAGLKITFDGDTLLLPATIEAEVGSQHSLNAPATFIAGDSLFAFSNWSDAVYDLPRIIYMQSFDRTIRIYYNKFKLGNGDGLLGNYYNDQNFDFAESPSLTRIDPQINFDWGVAAPDSLINANYFSVRWTGYVQPINSEALTFKTLTNNGVRLWVNDKLIINHWTPQDTKEWTGTIGLLGGTKYKIKMEYFDKDTIALAQLRWKSDNIPLSLIPTQQLYSSISPQDAIWTGKIWNDKNYNGVIDAGENPIPDTPVRLYNVLDQYVKDTFTDINGIYTLNVPPTGGIYHLEISGDVGQGYYQNTTGLTYGTTSNYYQLDGGDTITLNAGYAVPEARAEFLIYYDKNQDLIPAFDDQVLKDVKVYLMQGNNIKIDSLLTDSTGYCTFKKIIPGSYFIQVANSDSTLYPVFGLMPDYTTPLFTLPPGTAIYKQLVFFKKPVVGILETAQAAKENWRIFPNPPEDHLNVAIEENNAPRSILLSLVDAQGKCLQQYTLTTNLGQNNLSIPVQHLPAGLYHVLLESAGKMSVRRFLKE